MSPSVALFIFPGLKLCENLSSITHGYRIGGIAGDAERQENVYLTRPWIGNRLRFKCTET